MRRDGSGEGNGDGIIGCLSESQDRGLPCPSFGCWASICSHSMNVVWERYRGAGEPGNDVCRRR